MRYPDLSKKFECDCPDFSKNPDVRCGEIRASTSRASEFVRLRNEEKSCFVVVVLLLLLLLLLNTVLEDFRMRKSRFMWMCNAKKSGQVLPGRPNLSACDIRIYPRAIYKKKKNKSKMKKRGESENVDRSKRRFRWIRWWKNRFSKRKKTLDLF